MQALFAAPDLVVLAGALGESESVGEFYDKVEKLGDGDYLENVKEYIESPLNLKFGWVKFDKDDSHVDFFSNLAILSANNSYTAKDKEIIMTQDSVFVSINLLRVYKNVIEMESKDDSSSFDVGISDKVDYSVMARMAENMYKGDEATFHEIVVTDNGPQMFMLSGVFTNDTWSILETIGPVARMPIVMQSEPALDKEYPGFVLIFGLGMGALAQIASASDGFPEHIKRDFMKLPRQENQDETDK